MPTQVIVPVKSFRLGKQRLASALSPLAREQLARDLAAHVTNTVNEAGLSPVIVSSDHEVGVWAKAFDFEVVPDPGDGLDAAAGAAANWASKSGDSWLILHSDLPLLRPSDVRALLAGMMGDRAVLAPSSDGGTSAIGFAGPFAFSFGVGSFHRHLARFDAPRIVARRGLLLDVDSADDLVAAQLDR